MSSPSRIEWLAWDEAAFARASATQRPILLRIGATWSASCRLMEREADADPAIVAAVERDFVPVYVDTDARPDVNERYNLGGWPTNAFLTPRGGLITGGTTFPVETFALLLARVAQSWNERRGDVEDAVAATRREHEQKRRARTTGETPAADAVEFVVDHTMDAFDFRYGGFGYEPKFAHPLSIELLLAEFVRTGEARLRDAALMSLEAMLGAGPGRGLLDAGGGFYHYATRRNWSEPCYEKKLDEQARLLSAYLSAHQLTGEARWAAAARSIVAFVDSTLADHTRSVFRASQASDPGVTYWSLAPAARAAFPAPAVDAAVYTSWNAEMASAYIKAGLVLGSDAMLEFGVAVVDRLAADARVGPDESLLAHQLDGDRGAGPATLADQVYTARALVDAYEASGGFARLARAAEILDAVHSRFRDAVHDSYSDALIDRGAEGLLHDALFPLPENSVAAETLMRLGAHLDAPSMRERAQTLLRSIAPIAAEHGFLAPRFALAVMRSLEPEPLWVYISDAEQYREMTRALIRAAHAVYAPFKVVKYLSPERDTTRLRQLHELLPGGPAAVVCRGVRCAEPTSDSTRLITLVARAALARFGST